MRFPIIGFVGLSLSGGRLPGDLLEKVEQLAVDDVRVSPGKGMRTSLDRNDPCARKSVLHLAGRHLERNIAVRRPVNHEDRNVDLLEIVAEVRLPGADAIMGSPR